MMQNQPYESAIPHLTMAVCCTGDDHAMVKREMNAILPWCTAQFGKIGDGWGIRMGQSATHMIFRNDADAMHFVVRWRGTVRA